MHKFMSLIGCLLLAAVFAFPISGNAGPIPYDGFVVVAAGQTCVTSDVPLAAGAFDIDRIVFYNSGAVTSAVAVTASDVGVFTPVASFALSASGGSNQWPRRQEVANTATNNYRYTASALRLITNKPTNATDVVIYYRVVFAPED